MYAEPGCSQEGECGRADPAQDRGHRGDVQGFEEGRQETEKETGKLAPCRPGLQGDFRRVVEELGQALDKPARVHVVGLPVPGGEQCREHEDEHPGVEGAAPFASRKVQCGPFDLRHGDRSDHEAAAPEPRDCPLRGSTVRTTCACAPR